MERKRNNKCHGIFSFHLDLLARCSIIYIHSGPRELTALAFVLVEGYNPGGLPYQKLNGYKAAVLYVHASQVPEAEVHRRARPPASDAAIETSSSSTGPVDGSRPDHVALHVARARSQS